jgi:hypothetical protein
MKAKVKKYCMAIGGGAEVSFVDKEREIKRVRSTDPCELNG